MTEEELCQVIEWEGWLYVLTEVSPDEMDDAGVGEALQNVQEAFHDLVKLLPDLEVDIILDEESELELDFGD